MTFKEHLEKDHPNEEFRLRGALCPYAYGYENEDSAIRNGKCMYVDLSCSQCWDREIPEEGTLTFNHTGEPLAKVEKIIEENGGVTAHIEPIIKDSGDRTQFESGAVRDMREGKGRCDLMPLEVVSHMFTENPYKEDPVIQSIGYFQDTVNTDYLYDVLVKFCNKQYDGFVPTMLLEVAKHYEEGAKKYGENNWQNGIPTWCYIDSAIRHYLKWLRGDTDEPHDRAFVWNLMCCIWEVDHREKNKEE